MPKVPEFYSINENKKPKDKQVYHNNSACVAGRDIKTAKEEKLGMGGYRPCDDCIKETKLGH